MSKLQNAAFEFFKQYDIDVPEYSIYDDVVHYVHGLGEGLFMPGGGAYNPFAPPPKVGGGVELNIKYILHSLVRLSKHQNIEIEKLWLEALEKCKE